METNFNDYSPLYWSFFNDDSLLYMDSNINDYSPLYWGFLMMTVFSIWRLI